jgi:hypothetical protein
MEARDRGEWLRATWKIKVTRETAIERLVFVDL